MWKKHSTQLVYNGAGGKSAQSSVFLGFDYCALDMHVENGGCSKDTPDRPLFIFTDNSTYQWLDYWLSATSFMSWNKKAEVGFEQYLQLSTASEDGQVFDVGATILLFFEMV